MKISKSLMALAATGRIQGVWSAAAIIHRRSPEEATPIENVDDSATANKTIIPSGLDENPELPDQVPHSPGQLSEVGLPMASWKGTTLAVPAPYGNETSVFIPSTDSSNSTPVQQSGVSTPLASSNGITPYIPPPYGNATSVFTPSTYSNNSTTTLTSTDAPIPGAIDITDIVNNLLDDSALFHNLTETHVEAIEICKSYAFDLTALNYHISGTDAFLRKYVETNEGRDFYQKHGLMATIAFDYLGLRDFKCRIGLQSRCHIECPQVVSSIKDLEVARQVYFALTSAGNLLAVADVVHDSLLAAQSNVGFMARQMSRQFFYRGMSKGENHRAVAFQFFMSMVTWTAQQVFQAIIPVVPWRSMQDYLVLKLSTATGKSYGLNGQPDRIDELGELGFRKWKGETIAKYMQAFTDPPDDPGNVGTFKVPAVYGGHNKWAPGGNTIMDWAAVNARPFRKWQRWIYGSIQQMDPWSANTNTRTVSWTRFFPDFRTRRMTDGWESATKQCLADMREILKGTARYIQGKWWYLTNSQVEGGPNSLTDVERANPAPPALGPMENWDERDHWRHEFGPHTDDFLLDVYTRSIPHIFPEKSIPQSRIKNLTEKLDFARGALKRLMPIFPFYIMPMGIRSAFDKVNYRNPERTRGRASLLETLVRQTGQHTRTLIAQKIDSYFSAENSRELINLLSMGSFLPANHNMLQNWSSPKIEGVLTRNMYMKTLNYALKQQRIWITCTPDTLHKPDPTRFTLKGSEPSTCEDDNTGAQNLKACINQHVCYLQKWNARGFPIAHHLEAPFGYSKLARKTKIYPHHIIKSSVLSARYKHTVSDLQLLQKTANLANGPSPEFLTDPTTPGMFSVPICWTPKSWAGPIDGYSALKVDVDPNHAMKSLPCYCGPMGRDTRKIWMQTKLFWSSPASKREYLTHLCPRQINAKLKSPLERWIALCRLQRVKRYGIISEGTDRMCNFVIRELGRRGVARIEQVGERKEKAYMCIVERRKWWRKGECERWWDMRVEDVWDVVERERGEGKEVEGAAVGKGLVDLGVGGEEEPDEVEEGEMEEEEDWYEGKEEEEGEGDEAEAEGGEWEKAFADAEGEEVE